MLTGAAQHGHYQLGAVDYATVAVGPDRVAEAVELGLVATAAPDGQPVVPGVRGPSAGGSTYELRVPGGRPGPRPPRCATRWSAWSECTTCSAAPCSFDVNEHRHHQMVSFPPPAELTRDDVVLPEDVLDAVERHVVRTLGTDRPLTAHGHHLKRGLLLHGPVVTGKTHTVRCLITGLAASTVVVLSGRALHLLPAASALVRRLTPSVLVIEDVA